MQYLLYKKNNNVHIINYSQKNYVMPNILNAAHP